MNLSALLALITTGYAATTVPLATHIDEEFFNKLNIIHTSQHDIINIFMPTSSTKAFSLFFVEADQANGHITYKGLYVLKFSNDKNTTKLILEGGKDVTCDADKIYIGAEDGIYIFNEKEMKAEKYGSVTENIKNIAKVNGSDLIYILTDDNQLYRVTENGNKMTLDVTIVNAQQIVLDIQQNLYYYTSDKELWVLSGGVKKKSEDLPKDIFYLRLLKPHSSQEGVLVVINNAFSRISSNGSIQFTNLSLLVKPSAYSMEVGWFQFYGYNKKIYMYNLVKLVAEMIGEAMQNYYSKH